MSANFPAALADMPQGARVVPVKGDSLQPRYRDGDAMFVVPCDRYIGEGIYAFEALPGAICFYVTARVFGKAAYRLSVFNEHYNAYEVTAERFAEMLVGKAVASCKILDGNFFW